MMRVVLEVGELVILQLRQGPNAPLWLLLQGENGGGDEDDDEDDDDEDDGDYDGGPGRDEDDGEYENPSARRVDKSAAKFVVGPLGVPDLISSMR